MTGFKEIRFPTNISYGGQGGPEYSTDIVTNASGKEMRNINWGIPRARYNVSQSVKTEEQMKEISEFFRNVKGRAYGFRFKDHADFKANKQLIAHADGLETSFQLIKKYGDEIRKITKPVKNTVSVYLDDVLTQVNLYPTTGIIKFNKAPNKGQKITASFQFDVPVRFDTDYLEISLDDYGSYSWDNIHLIELKL